MQKNLPVVTAGKFFSLKKADFKAIFCKILFTENPHGSIINLTSIVSIFRGVKIMTEWLYNLLALVWIIIAGTDSRWVK